MSSKVWVGFVVVVVVIALGFGVFSSQRTTEQNLKLGATFPLTGEVASYGQKAKRGIELAVEGINGKNGLLGRHVTVDFQDDRNDKKEAVSIVTKFATIDKVPVIFGSAGSSVTLAIVPIANRNKIVLISPISSSSTLTKVGGPFFFRTVPADNLQAEILAKWVHEAGAKRAAIVYTNNSWGKPLAEGFQENFAKLGGTVISQEGVAENATDFRTIITKLKSMPNIDAVVSPTYPKEGGVFVRQVKELGLKTTLFGGDNWGSPEFRNVAGNASEGVYYTTPTKTETTAYLEFSKQYKAKYGEQPDVFSAYAYDAATAVFQAIKECGIVDPQKIRDTLSKISFSGVSGNIAFRPNGGDLASEGFARMRIENGQPVLAK